ncbi:MAG TPA: hypothetical protein VE871_02510, partial [Longimicrobium sp.]|nr:hypothetical protein [Longimicrobium sp.]
MKKRSAHRRAWLRAALLVTATLAAAACGDQAPEAGPTGTAPATTVGSWPNNTMYGFVVGGASSQAEANALMDRARSAGVGWVKLTLYWPTLQPHGGPIDSARIAGARYVVKAARERGLRVVAMLERYPGFARGCGTPGTMYYGLFDPGNPANDYALCEAAWQYPPDDGLYNTLQMYVTELMDRWFATYPYDVQVYSVGNEFNHPAWFRVLNRKFLPAFQGQDRDEVAEYCKVVNYVSGGTRPRGKQLIAGELAVDGNPSNDPAGSPYQWLRRVLQTCAGSFDIVGVHSYHSHAILDSQ